MKHTSHLLMGILTLLLFGSLLMFPLQMAIFAFIGVIIPDLDFRPRKYHHKMFHNIWFLVSMVFVASKFGADAMSMIMLSIGFLSHMISDALTHEGIMPFWPIKKPKFNGPIKSGSLGEYLLILVLIMAMYVAGRIV
jgi:membrane-bound metal-dependent hydrolase YbcI (DUF457 family)